MQLETKRLLLRPLTEADCAALALVLTDPVNMQHYPNPLDDSGVKRWIAVNIERYRTFGFGLWGVILSASNELIGDCGLSMQLINGTIRPEIGYHIRRDQQRRGYAKEAAIACRDWTFQNTPFKRVYAYMTESNTGSYQTAMAMGMAQVDSYHDETHGAIRVYAIERERWKNL